MVASSGGLHRSRTLARFRSKIFQWAAPELKFLVWKQAEMPGIAFHLLTVIIRIAWAVASVACELAVFMPLPLLGR